MRHELCSHPAHSWATWDFVLRHEALGPPARQELCSPRAHLWATAVSVPRSEVVDPLAGSGYVATQPTCGALLTVSPALKRFRSTTWQGLCSHPAHLWATFNYVPRTKALGTHHTAWVV